MTRRDKNIRKACDEIDAQINKVFEYLRDNHGIINMNIQNINKLTHRIKRTTWRGTKRVGNINKDIIKKVYMPGIDQIMTYSVPSGNYPSDKHPPQTDY